MAKVAIFSSSVELSNDLSMEYFKINCLSIGPPQLSVAPR